MKWGEENKLMSEKTAGIFLQRKKKSSLNDLAGWREEIKHFSLFNRLNDGRV